MIYRALGNGGVQVSLVGLGTVKLGRDQAVKYPSPFAIPTASEARALLDRARDLGINLIDTAPAYGDSEARLGELLRDDRDAWVLCTKAGEAFDGKTSSYDFSPQGLRASIERSLERLRTDRLDVVLVHSNGEDHRIIEEHGALATLAEEKRRGLVRAVGISVKSASGLNQAVAAGADVVMATANLDNQTELPAIADAGRAGVGVLVKKALASGHRGLDSLRFVARAPGVTSIIVGTIDPQHLAANVAAVTAAADGSSEPG